MPITQGLPMPVAHHARVATGIDHGMRDAARFQDVDAAIHRVALADAAQVDAHAGLAEGDGALAGSSRSWR